jgi:hypothetical protein
MADCPLCKGNKVVKCPNCKGTGTDGANACYLCEGKSDGGKETTVTCPRCNGSGED